MQNFGAVLFRGVPGSGKFDKKRAEGPIGPMGPKRAKGPMGPMVSKNAFLGRFWLETTREGCKATKNAYNPGKAVKCQKTLNLMNNPIKNRGPARKLIIIPSLLGPGPGPGPITGLVEATIIRVAPKRPGKKESIRQNENSRQKGKHQAKKKAAGKQRQKQQAFSKAPGTL